MVFNEQQSLSQIVCYLWENLFAANIVLVESCFALGREQSLNLFNGLHCTRITRGGRGGVGRVPITGARDYKGQ